MKKMNWLFRLGLFALILVLGTGAALFAGESRGLALADLSSATINTLTRTADGGTLYAALSGQQRGIFRSDDHGRSWQRVSVVPTANVSALAVHPQNPDFLLAGTSTEAGRTGGSIWFSSNGGLTWDQTLYALPMDTSGQSPQVSVLAANPAQPDLIYMGTSGQGLHRFDVRMGQFEQLGPPEMSGLYVNDIVTTQAGPAYAVTAEGLLRIDGADVTRLTLPDGIASLAVDPTNPNILYAGTVGYGAHRSGDGGQSWKPINSGLNLQPGVILRVTAISIDPENAEHIVLATAFGVGSRLASDGIYESFNHGENWAKIANLDKLVTDLTIDSGGIYATTNHGLLHLGQSVPASPASLWQRFESLSSPSDVQVIILALTLGLGAWVLLARLTWLPAWAEQRR